jgi:hypothetical protein
MPVTSCPPWEYKDFPGASAKLAERAPEILIWLYGLSPLERVAKSRDTRALHRWLFDGLTPEKFGYYAGHYRGENFLCLLHCSVGIAGNPLVGTPPSRVASAIYAFADDLRAATASLDILWPVNEQIIPKAVKIRRTAEIVAAIFNSFLLIHPYINGNGHMARFIAVAIFSLYGLLPRRWPINERPPDPPYSELIRRYQHGDTEGFVRFLMSCI